MMKRIVCIIMMIVMMLSLCSCSERLKCRMYEYYLDDSNYQEVTGEIVEIVDPSWFSIKILSDSPDFKTGPTVRFMIMPGYECEWYEKQQYLEFKPGDIITFTSAPMHFYNGHILPIVALEKDGTTYFEFDDHIQIDLLRWISNLRL